MQTAGMALRKLPGTVDRYDEYKAAYACSTTPPERASSKFFPGL